MTLKYESELLYELMKRDGDDTPSDVLPYESELKEKYLNQVVGAYPKLQDYRPEWLNYNLYHHLPSDFPTESVTGVSNATFQNVVPYAYQSAILKGQTLVNLFPNLLTGIFDKNTATKDEDSLVFGVGSVLELKTDILKTSTTYTFILDIKENTLEGSGDLFQVVHNNNGISSTPITITNEVGIIKYKTTTLNDLSGKKISLYTRGNTTSGKIKIKSIVLIEGDYTNVDVPYFNGMQSVKMPVLTTTGKNLFNVSSYVKGTMEKEYYSQNGDKLQINNLDERTNVTYGTYKAKKGETLTLSTNPKVPLRIFDITSGIMYASSTDGILTYTAKTDGEIGFKFIAYEYPTLIDVHLEKGTDATAYEPFKSNILTCNEEVTLRGIGDVQDTLNCLTGEVTERIEEVVLDGSDNGVSYSLMSTNTTDYIVISCWFDYSNHRKRSGGYLSTLPQGYGNNSSILDTPYFGGDFYGDASVPNKYVVKIEKSKLISPDLDGFKHWLSKNPVEVQYVATESIKTVDLTCVNEQGESVDFMPIEGTMHVTTSSDTLPPLLDMTVPVEAITQNLNSFANMKEE